MGNPFLHDSAELLVLDTRDVLSESVVATVWSMQTGQYKTYYQSVITEKTSSIHEAIKKNSFPLFNHPTPKENASMQTYFNIEV